MVDAGRESPEDERQRDDDHARSQSQQDVRAAHPQQTAGDESAGADTVNDDTARERTSPEQAVAQRHDDADGGRRHVELGDTEVDEVKLGEQMTTNIGTAIS